MYRGRERGTRLELILTLVFYTLALASVVCYFVYSDERYVFMTLGFAAIATRIISYLIKLMK